MKKFSKDITPEQLARDFQTLKELTTRLKVFPKFIAGPDVTRNGATFLEKLETIMYSLSTCEELFELSESSQL